MSSLKVLVLLILFGMGASSGARATVLGGLGKGGQCRLHEGPAATDTIPWPWGEEADMPWDQLDGTWRIVGSPCEGLFSFETTGRQLEPSARVLNVVQYDTRTCERISWGYGVEVDKVLQASMTSGKLAFNLTVRAFDHRLTSGGKVQRPPKTPGAMPYIVLTMYSKEGWHIRRSFELRKVSKDLKPSCQKAKFEE